MERIGRLITAALMLGICSAYGCGQSSTNQAAGGAPSGATANPATDAIAKAAADFLDAVLKGDTQRASARLTPQAMQRIIDSGKQFAPPGLETATFRIGEVRAPSVDKAFVQCVLTDTSQAGGPRSEEMCCLMRRVDNDWRVSGIAYWTGPDQPGTMSDFETGQSTPIPRQPSQQNMAAGSAPAAPQGQPVGQTLPPRTAQEVPPTTTR